VDAPDTSPGTAEQEILNVLNVEAEEASPVNAGVRETVEGVPHCTELGCSQFLVSARNIDCIPAVSQNTKTAMFNR